MHNPSTALKVVAHESCFMLGRFFKKKRPGIKPLSDVLEHISCGNCQYFLCFGCICPSHPLGEMRGRSGVFGVYGLGFKLKAYLEGQGDLVSRLVTPITHIITLVIPIINLLIKSP